MARYIVRRLLQLPLLFLGATVLTFALVHLVPGSPVNNLRESIPGISEEDLARVERSLGLDQPLYKQYLSWLGQVVQGDLGISMQDRGPVRDAIVNRLPNTLLLTGSATIVSMLIAFPLGVFAAIRRNSVFDQVVNLLVTLGSALPTFWIGLVFILVFSVQATEWGLPTLPSSGMRSVIGGGGIGDRLQHLLLPMTTLAVFNISGWLRMVRAQMLEVLSQEYIKTARSKGLRETVVIYRHAFRNALLPLITMIGLQIPQLVAGAAIVETIFSWPGIGLLSVQAATGRDYTMIIGVTVFIALFTILSNLLTDVLYASVDPRISFD